MAAMTEQEWRAFLREPVRSASLATTRRDGRPHVAPVWYDLDDDGTIVFNTGAGTVKGQAVRRDGTMEIALAGRSATGGWTAIHALDADGAPSEVLRAGCEG